MKSVNKIPKSKIKRASKIVGTGAKVGVNYIKYYGSRLVKSKEDAQQQLDKDNAEDIYNSLQELKGSPLKMAQMMSMDKNILPSAYVEKFSLSQFSVPPLSYSLVVKTFNKEFGKSPTELFDTFNKEASHAASIGQVHEASRKGKKLAVKIQYPGVADSIKSDLALVKPMAKRLFNIKGKASDKYFKEVEEKLLEETDYVLEVKKAEEIIEKCQSLPNIRFPKYHKKRSGKRIITMEWMDGLHLSEYAESIAPQKSRNILGQSLWDFYMYQIHVLNEFQADPHPGNFLVSQKNELIALDFGCTKKIPEKFYRNFFKLMYKKNVQDKGKFEGLLEELGFFKESDSVKDKLFVMELFGELLTLLAKPFHSDRFDFSNESFFQKIAEKGDELSKNKDLRKMDSTRGSKHFIYLNRTFFGLYNLLHQLKSEDIIIDNYKNYLNSTRSLGRVG